MAKSLTDAQLKAAIKAREEDKPLPSGVNWSAHREPQFMTIEEYEEFETTGGVPDSARSRILAERRALAAFDFRGTALEGKAKSAVIEGIEGGESPVENDAPGDTEAPVVTRSARRP